MRALDATWRKSTRSNINGACVEARYANRIAQVRDSKDRHGPVLTFTPAAWSAFLATLRPTR